jgi:tetratricopeptide (TPR) repeat protein
MNILIRPEMLATHGNNWEQLCSIYNLKGVIKFIENHQDSALYYYNKAYEIGKAHGVAPIQFPRIISNIGECYATENPALASTYFNQALALARETHNQIAEASITAIIGHAYLRGNDLKNAELHLQGALELARTLGLRRVIRHAYAGLVDIKLKQGRGAEAVQYQQTLLCRARQPVEFIQDTTDRRVRSQACTATERAGFATARKRKTHTNPLEKPAHRVGDWFDFPFHRNLFLAALSLPQKPRDVKPGN